MAMKPQAWQEKDAKWRVVGDVRGPCRSSIPSPAPRHLRTRRRLGGRELADEIPQIERSRDHRDPRGAIRRPRPLLAWPIPIEFDPVRVRIAKIEGLTDAVVGGPLERNAGLV